MTTPKPGVVGSSPAAPTTASPRNRGTSFKPGIAYPEERADRAPLVARRSQKAKYVPIDQAAPRSKQKAGSPARFPSHAHAPAAPGSRITIDPHRGG